MLEPPFLILFFYLLPLLGDLGKIDKNGFVYIVDRKKDIIIRGGENISCAEVEGALYEHPDILECSVFGIPDVRLGEKVAATCVLKEGCTPTQTQIQKFIKTKLADFKVPYMIVL